MADETGMQQAQAVGGVSAPSGGGAVLVPRRALDPGATSDAPVLSVAGGVFSDDIAAIHRLVQALYQLLLERAPMQRSYTDRATMLQAGVYSEELLNVRPSGYTQVAVFATAGCNLALSLPGYPDVNVVVPPAHFVTLQQPTGTRIGLKAGDPNVMVIFRYSDQIFGTVLP